MGLNSDHHCAFSQKWCQFSYFSKSFQTKKIKDQRQKMTKIDSNNKAILLTQTRALVVVEPHRPPMTNVGTEPAFSRDHCKYFQRSNQLLGSENRRCDHRLAQEEKELLSEIGVQAVTTHVQVDYEVDFGHPASCRFS